VDVTQRIQEQLKASPVVLYMKGTPDFPQCGFSAAAVRTLEACGASFSYVNIFEDPELREALKRYSNWPTYPQAVRQWRAGRRLRHPHRHVPEGRAAAAARRGRRDRRPLTARIQSSIAGPSVTGAASSGARSSASSYMNRKRLQIVQKSDAVRSAS